MKKRLIKIHKNVVAKIEDFLNKGNFYLAGGTAVFYYLNHRISEDLDFFTSRKFDFRDFKVVFKDYEVLNYLEDTVHCIIDNVKVSFFYYPYTLIGNKTALGTIEIAGLEDILAMKTSAIIQRGSKKDFTDAYFIIKKLNLDSREVIELFRKKYGNINHFILRKAFTYFEDADSEPDLRMIKQVKWESIKKFFIKEFLEE